LTLILDGSGASDVFKMRAGFRLRHKISLHIPGTNSQELRLGTSKKWPWRFLCHWLEPYRGETSSGESLDSVSQGIADVAVNTFHGK
jgi:hypothetical protein